MRINEPYVKISYILWLVAKGVNNIRVSVDGTEPEHQIVAQTLESKAYRRQPLKGSKVNWTGLFTKEAVDVTVLSQPGIDIEAQFPDGKVLLAECKGEPTPKGVKSGTDLTAFYSALGQLIIIADDEGKSPLNLVLVVPDTPRLRDIVIRAAQNTRLKKLGVGLALVDESGKVTEITPNLR
ncbi:hypothetical protein ACFLVH_04365 [Chloroflexota bacterium]